MTSRTGGLGLFERGVHVVDQDVRTNGRQFGAVHRFADADLGAVRELGGARVAEGELGITERDAVQFRQQIAGGLLIGRDDLEVVQREGRHALGLFGRGLVLEGGEEHEDEGREAQREGGKTGGRHD